MDDPVEEVVDRLCASGHGFIERGIAGLGVQLGNGGGQPLVRRVQLIEKVSPRCRASWPIFFGRQTVSTFAREASQGFLLPHHDVDHELPNGVGVCDRTRRCSVGVNAIQNLPNRRPVPRFAAIGPL